MRQGFSLVELSIVLVILGLLTGGILTGQNLIRAAELRSVSTEFTNYQTAMNTFRDKYFGLPGDFNKATQFWGVAHATPATCITTVGAGTATCDGNGNGQIYQVAAVTQEEYRFWQHLANAGLIEGSYTGVQGAGGINDTVPGTNAPRGKYGNSGWHIRTETTPLAGNTALFDGTYMTRWAIGADSGTSNTVQARLFKPEDVWNIDTKLDDGRPGRGRVIVGYWDECSDATASSMKDANYLLTETGNQCFIIFLQENTL